MTRVWCRLSQQLSNNRTKIVISDKHTAWTGDQALTAANALASALRNCGVGYGDRVVIHLQNSAEYVAGILACLKLGAVFTPIAFHKPTRREVDILERCSPHAALLDRVQSESIEMFSGRSLPVIDVPLVIASEPVITANTLPNADNGDDSVYCVFTSGSTGGPKGVLIGDDSLNHFIDCTIDTFCITNETRALCISPFHFDGAFGSIFSVLAAGGSIIISKARHLTPIEFIRLCTAYDITHTSFSPSFLRILAASQQLGDLKQSHLQTIGLGGEDCRRGDLLSLKQVCPKIRVFNRYGPTEATVVVSSCELTADLLDSDDKLPIGIPAPGTEFYLADGNEVITGTGIPGELLIGGMQLMQGYLNAPAKTEAVLDRVAVPGKTLYRSGDLVYRDRFGRYVYLDRLDNVVNRNGVRISLGEISRACSNVRGVKDAVALSFDKLGGLRIVVYAATDRRYANDIRQALKMALPVQMQPDQVLCVSELPRTTSGKLDTERLKASG